MLVRIEAEIEQAVVYVDGEIDMATAPRVATALSSARSGGARTVVCDLAGVTFMDSSGLSVLIDAHQACGPDERFVLSRVTESVRRLLEVVGMDQVFELTDEVPAPTDPD